MKKEDWPVKQPGNAFGSHTECPKCGSKTLVRRYVPASDNQHFENKIQQYLEVYCGCGFVLGREHTKDHVA